MELSTTFALKDPSIREQAAIMLLAFPGYYESVFQIGCELFLNGNSTISWDKGNLSFDKHSDYSKNRASAYRYGKN